MAKYDITNKNVKVISDCAFTERNKNVNVIRVWGVKTKM